MSGAWDEYSFSFREVRRREFLQQAGKGVGLLAGGISVPGAVFPVERIERGGSDDLDPVVLLRTALGYDTQNRGEGGVTLPHAEMLRAKWQSAGVSTRIIPTPKGDNVHLIARIRGEGGAPPVAVLGHSDVVPVEREKWSVDPFAGVVKDGQVWGRGALDMKGASAAFMAALLRHVRQGARFDRDIIVLVDCDEEAGPYGTRWLARNHWREIAAGMVLTEGGWFLAQRDGRTPMLVTATRQDKIYFNLDLVADGTATHSSKPMPDAAMVRLARAVDRLSRWQAPVMLTPVTREYFAALGRATSDAPWARAISLMLAASSGGGRERAARLVVARSPYPWLHGALLRTTAAFVIESAGYRENVIPSTATARINCRALPGGQHPREFISQVRSLLSGSGVAVRLVPARDMTEAETMARIDGAFRAAPSVLDTPLFEALRAAARRTYPQAGFAPALFEAGTSLEPWVSRGIPGYGVYPYVVDNDQMVTMHGNDERVGIEALRRGTSFMYSVFDRFRVR